MSKGARDDGVVFHAGFPNAAEDGVFGSLSLDTLLVRHRASTYFWRLEHAIAELDWSAGDVVVVDRAVEPHSGVLVVAIADDDFVLARVSGAGLVRVDGSVMEPGTVVWGVVTYVIHKL